MEQIIEVEYDKNMVIEDNQALKDNNRELLDQDTFNEDTLENMLESDVIIDELTEN